MRPTTHRLEYAAEAAALAIFMISASLFTMILEHYQSPLPALVPDPLARRALMGAAMGLTAAAIIYSPLGARSGAHMNPAVTLAFLRLGAIAPRDAAWYVLAQFAGGVAGMVVAYALVGARLAEPAVYFVTTWPGPGGVLTAGLGELAISFVMMSVLLHVVAHRRTMRWAGAVAGLLVMLFITFEAPLSGMSMNPARTLGPALLAGRFEALWIYVVVPPLGMLGAAELFKRGRARLSCAKLNHASNVRCIFCGRDVDTGVTASGAPSRGGRTETRTEPSCITT